MCLTLVWRKWTIIIPLVNLCLFVFLFIRRKHISSLLISSFFKKKHKGKYVVGIDGWIAIKYSYFYHIYLLFLNSWQDIFDIKSNKLCFIHQWPVRFLNLRCWVMCLCIFAWFKYPFVFVFFKNKIITLRFLFWYKYVMMDSREK